LLRVDADRPDSTGIVLDTLNASACKRGQYLRCRFTLVWEDVPGPRSGSEVAANDSGPFDFLMIAAATSPWQLAASRSPMTTAVRTTTDIDIDLIQANWAYLHSTWDGDLIGAELAWAHVDELLDERLRVTHTGARA
jgi:hypothetical protein